MSATLGAERSIVVLEGTDLPGFDYSINHNSSPEACEAACLEDRICRAFTFNEQAGWCFLKSEAGPETPFEGAVSGRVRLSPLPEITAAIRQAELPFPAQDLVDAARRLASELPITDPAPTDTTYAGLVASGDEAALSGNPAGALVAYRQALGIVGNDPTLWLKLAQVALARAESEAQREGANDSFTYASLATSAAINGFLLSESVKERAETLGALAQGLERREMWRESIATYRASLALVGDAGLEGRLELVLSQHGFRITSNEVDVEAVSPRICAVFSETLPLGNVELADYVLVRDAPKIAVETEESQICIEGVEHGQRYEITFRAGLPSASGESLRKDVELSVYVPDRSPFVGFANSAYVMPKGLGGGLPINAINAEAADLAIYRIGDRSIATAVRNGIFGNALSFYSAEDIASQHGEKVWEGQITLSQGQRNQMGVTAVPVSEVLTDMEPGAYVITARVADSDQNYWDDMATQWFIVTDLGLTTVEGEDGVHAFVRSLESAQPVQNARVRLVAVNNEILGEARTDAEGRAVFAPGLARGEGGRAPQLLTAETETGDYAFLDLSRSAFDLTDRGVEGRPAPGPLDLFATTERGVYRPGETVFLTALLRDAQARAIPNIALTLKLERPDGVIASTQLLSDAGAGSYFTSLSMVDDAMRGSWHARLYADPEGDALANVNFLVEDFEPERLAFEVSAEDEAFSPVAPLPISVFARYLYGATAPDLAIEADAVLRPTMSLEGFPGYSFGRMDDPIETIREPLGQVGTTDAQGVAMAEVSLPAPQPTTRLLEAEIILRLVDTSGRTVERSLTRPVLADGQRIGIRPRFDSGSGLGENSEASFDIIVVAPGGGAVARRDLSWTLSRIETNYQWYRDENGWKWEAITSNREVANGTLDTRSWGPASISAPVRWGRYLLEVETAGPNPTSSSYEFYAGYYFAEAGSDTPDTLEVAFDKPAYRIGEVAELRLEPQFAGTALVMVIDNRIIDMQAVEVPLGGTTVGLPVTEQWGPGAYVTAILYRPSSVEERRMPSRALGLAFADVDPGERLLDLALRAPAEASPREAFAVEVDLGNLAAGETAYVAVAAVDLGILTLTNFETPEPDGWFFGQRRLGMDIRDLYGRLIDPTQGSPGAMRSGGDAGASRLGTPPPISVLVAQHSGIVQVGADGIARVEFEMPDFSGTVRLMAMAWTDDALGHGEADVIVRDPVVVALSPPRFLRLGDQSRLLVEINNVSGLPGRYGIGVSSGAGLSIDAGQPGLELATGERTALSLGLRGTGIGDFPLQVEVAGPDGMRLLKDLRLGVRPTSAPRTVSTLEVIEPGATLDLDASRFAGLVPTTGTITLAIGPIARLNVPELLLALDRYPYGCSEQITSRALPLLYLNEVAQMIGLGSDAELDQRIDDAITDLLSKQSSSGSFGFWGPFSATDLWLDSYVTEFLIRARDRGYAVPELALTRALDSLANQVSYAADFTKGGEDIAYALYVLSRAGRAAIGDLRYYFEARLDALATPLAKAQLGAALALYGDETRSGSAFRAALEALNAADNPEAYRPDYGSRLRDMAGVLALAAEFTPQGVDVSALTTRLAELRDVATYTSTQEDAWTLLAASALGRDTEDGSVAIDGEALTGAVYRRFNDDELANAAVSIANTGSRPVEAKLSVTGIPLNPPPASRNGFTITREFFMPDGTSFDPALTPVRQNERFVVVLRMTAATLGSGQYLAVDPLPAGFEIENPNLSAGGGMADLAWLEVDTPLHVEARTDQFVAAFRFLSDTSNFSAAYMVRAVSPGSFVLPGAVVEDMYRPERRANTDAGTVEVTAPQP